MIVRGSGLTGRGIFENEFWDMYQLNIINDYFGDAEKDSKRCLWKLMPNEQIKVQTVLISFVDNPIICMTAWMSIKVFIWLPLMLMIKW